MGRFAKSCQPPLPLYPVGATEISLAATLLEDDHGGVVYIWGNASFSWEIGDVVARHFGAVQLIVTKTARAAQVARALEISTSTLFRWCSEFAAHGVERLLLEKEGPKSQHVLDEVQIAKVKSMRAEGKSLREIVWYLGRSTSPVRQALGLIGKPLKGASTTADLQDDDTRVIDQEMTTTRLRYKAVSFPHWHYLCHVPASAPSHALD